MTGNSPNIPLARVVTRFANHHLRAIAACTFFWVGCGTLTLCPAATQPQTPDPSDSRRPNVVWLMSEDNSIHYLQHFFPGGAETPAITRLAAEGLTFRNAYSNSPVCSVARTTLITGCYAPRLGTQYHRRAAMVHLPDPMVMFPTLLRRAGYFTTNNSKQDYNALGGGAAWDQSSGKASWRNRPSEETPFFHVQTFGASHESSLHFDAQVFENQPTDHDPRNVPVHPYLPDTRLVRYTHARYLDRIAQIDNQVAGVVEQLQADGVWDNTILFYFGDHGGVLPRSKGYIYDTGLHVPLVVRVPERYRQQWEISAGDTDDRFVEFVDFGPTVLSMAGVATPDWVDGAPFLGRFAAEGKAFDSALGYADRFDEKYDLTRSLRRGNFHYIRNFQPFYPDSIQNNYRYKMLAYSQWRDQFNAGELTSVQSQFFQPRPAEMLFDLSDDPFEIHDLSSDPAYRERLLAMREELNARLKAMPDLSLLTEPMLIPAAVENPLQFGARNRSRIGKLLDIANLCLDPSSAKVQAISETLGAEDPLDRFWALTAWASLGRAAPQQLTGDVNALLDDPHPMVRARACEALFAVTGKVHEEALMKALACAETELQALWILNGVVYMRDHFPPDFDRDMINSPFGVGEIERRLEFLGVKRAE
jgi:uncharacterized sulfatase